MPIEEVTSTELVQRCSKCDSLNRLTLDNLEAGIAREGQADSHVVPLPHCPTCRASEFLFRSPDDEPEHPAPGSFGHLHRLLVDHVHAELVKREKVIPQLRDEKGMADQRFARPLAAETVARWFDKGLKIVPRPTEAMRRVAEGVKESGQ